LTTARAGSRCRHRRRTRKVELDPQKLQAIRDGMWGVVNGGGTGGRARVEGYDVAGKTGRRRSSRTKDVPRRFRSGKDLRDNAWFVFFAPRDNPEIAGVVFLEHGMHGPNAARVTHHIVDTFFAKRDGRPLPPAPTPAMMQFDFADSFPLPPRKPRLKPTRSRSVRCCTMRNPNPKSQIPNPKLQEGNWDSWDLGFGIWGLGFRKCFERRLYHHIDWAMVGAIVALCLIGLAQIYSTTAPEGGGASSIFFTQIWAILLGLVALSPRAQPRLPVAGRQVPLPVYRGGRRADRRAGLWRGARAARVDGSIWDR
jgi:hypothetical protein